MEKMEKANFGILKQKFSKNGVRKSDLYFKPHPETITQENEILYQANATYNQYVASFYKVSKVSASQKKLALEYHPDKVLLTNCLTQEDDTQSQLEDEM